MSQYYDPLIVVQEILEETRQKIVTFVDYKAPQLCDVEATPIPSPADLTDCLLHIALSRRFRELGLKECLYGKFVRPLSREQAGVALETEIGKADPGCPPGRDTAIPTTLRYPVRHDCWFHVLYIFSGRRLDGLDKFPLDSEE